MSISVPMKAMLTAITFSALCWFVVVCSVSVYWSHRLPVEHAASTDIRSIN